MAKFYAKAPDGTDATLSITVSGFTQSLQQNGWCKMPNGLILQWLEAYVMSHDGTLISLPISFSNIKYVTVTTPLVVENDIFWSNPSCVEKYTNSNLSQTEIGALHGANTYHFVIALGI